MKLIPTTRLTTDDLEGLMETYGGSIERDLATDRYWLRGARMDGRRLDIGPAVLSEVA